MLATTAFLALTGLPHWTQLEGYTFEQYLSDSGKEYGTTEYASRKAIFEGALTEIKAHNARTDSSYKKGLSMHTDKTDDEWAHAMKGYNRNVAFATHAARPKVAAIEDIDISSLPNRMDWREKNVVSDVKDQGGCGSCWAFSATETVESAVAVATGKLIKMAPQEYVDCAPNPKHCGGTGGCEGSTQWLAFNYSITAGIASESEYPYKGRDGNCKESSMTSVASISGYERLPANDYASLMKAVANVGPIAISVSAAWRHYTEGVYDDDCGLTIDHAVQLVGYGEDKGDEYWYVHAASRTPWTVHPLDPTH